MEKLGSTYFNTVNLPDFFEFAIYWRVIRNNYCKLPGVISEFIIKNNSQTTLTAANWQLIYSQSPRSITRTAPDSLVQIERINGDWHRIFPLEGFLLPPWEEVSIMYDYTDWWIKESDAPKGLYFEFNTTAGNTTLAVADNFNVLPLENAEQWQRCQYDRISAPNARSRWHANKKLTLVDYKDLIPVFPTPCTVENSVESISFNNPVRIFYTGEPGFEAGYLKVALEKTCKYEIHTIKGAVNTSHSISLQTDINVEVAGKIHEAYILEITREHTVSIKGFDKAGVFYAMQSLLSMAIAKGSLNMHLWLPVITAKDAPPFGCRGIHVNVAPESVYRFFEVVLNDVIKLYALTDASLEIVHVGGNEVLRGAWTESSMMQTKMEQLPHITGPTNMQGYFSERILEKLRKRNPKIAGWEEIALKKDENGNHVPDTRFTGGDVIPYLWNTFMEHSTLPAGWQTGISR